ncbi:hypothetical protein K493DRAFT_310485 [Basidiobolus meristosporus CBS 931.73]|uniref:Uncharacterized protein n=1 Tax=Basidiobolus meristosporus CBS 931.73 TaxID=1314790 RepID=A0A1Y1Z8Z3_9FUNG|nr:hypothetical protein K493DRAFT_310485 [Basidiobolus meristosporus CBS 931.73]|eukprot:ORY06728.1 hypothetical protein K493DRAFT_310485 [Basidiobolus meristosporus CBS 931.73]
MKSIPNSARYGCRASRVAKYVFIIALIFCIIISLLGFVNVDRDYTSYVEGLASRRTNPTLEAEDAQFHPMPLNDLIQMFPKDTNYFLYNWLSFLGFNNVRYMIEHAYYYGELMNRTVVLPHRVHCRSCLHEGYCRVLGHAVDDSKIMDLPDGKDGRYRWSIPIEEFIDMKHMMDNSGGKMIRMQDFLRLQLYYQDLDRYPDVQEEKRITYWNNIDPIEYLERVRGIIFQDGSADNFTLAFPELSYVGVDRINDVCAKPNSVDDLNLVKERAAQRLEAKQTTVDLYGYPDEPNYSVREFVTKPISLEEVEGLIGFAQEFSTDVYPQKMLHFTGRYIHWFPRRQFWFASEENRNKYDDFVLNVFKHPYSVREASNHLIRNLERIMIGAGISPIVENVTMASTGKHVELINFLGIHARRGDFIRYNWLSDLSSTEAWQQAMVKLTSALKKQKGLKIFYLATDETSPDAFDDLYQHGMIRIYDLMDQEFVAKYSHLATFGDWLALLDQEVLARSRFFVPTYLSSVSGGILNMRKKQGVEDSPATREWISTLLEQMNIRM